jgi:hypothetical protein
MPYQRRAATEGGPYESQVGAALRGGPAIHDGGYSSICRTPQHVAELPHTLILAPRATVLRLGAGHDSRVAALQFYSAPASVCNSSLGAG